MILVAGLHLVSWRCFLGVSAAVFTTIFTVVLTYVISTAAKSGPATYSMLLALYNMIRYDTRCYFNVRSKANMSQLNLPHGNRQLKSVKTEKKLNVEKQICSEIAVNSLGNPRSE